ncbi:hypothetical protein [Streptomyces sp. NPDC049915]|uniref:hypothetical protein n=1 Tax=Streptomyces sp. NPDC049915 TaxID=3155510 RepID=UPI0034356C77
MNITEDISRLTEQQSRSGESGPAGGAFGEILVESLSRADAGRAGWCMCISSVLGTRAGA